MIDIKKLQKNAMVLVWDVSVYPAVGIRKLAII